MKKEIAGIVVIFRFKGNVTKVSVKTITQETRKTRRNEYLTWLFNVLFSVPFHQFNTSFVLSSLSSVSYYFRTRKSRHLLLTCVKDHSNKMLTAIYWNNIRLWASIKPRLLFSRAGYASWGFSISSVSYEKCRLWSLLSVWQNYGNAV